MAEPAPTPLLYESIDGPAGPRHRPKWVYAIVGFYALILLALATATAWLPLLVDERPNAWIAGIASVLILAELSLLMTPVRAASRRPMSRRALWISLVGSGFLAGLLAMGALFALIEYFHRSDSPLEWIALVGGGLVWIFWALVFWFISYRTEPGRVAARLHRWLLAGSVLELLIAVPTHVVCRRRQECCAGVYTLLGICCGVAVMLLAFGPSVAFLYYRRWKQIQVPQPKRARPI